MRISQLAATVLAAGFFFGSATAAPLKVPFDFSRGAVGLDVTIRGAHLFALLDTGVDPSMIDIKRAQALGLKIDRKGGGEASGVGDKKSAVVYPATIDGLAIAGHTFAPFDALTGDTSPISAGYGRPIDAVLGYSLLKNMTVFIDYEKQTVDIGAGRDGAAARNCRVHWDMPLQFIDGDNTPIIPNFRFGAALGPGTLDTGSNSSVTLFPRALDLPGVRAAMVGSGESVHAGARGSVKYKSYTLGLPTGFGPFTLPAGTQIVLGSPMGDGDRRAANIGNRFFAALKLKILLDYPSKRITFYGQCAG